MNLTEIWPRRSNLCLVAYRKGTKKYVSLAHRSPFAAFEAAKGKQGLTDADFTAQDWSVGEIVPIDYEGTKGTARPDPKKAVLQGRVKEIINREDDLISEGDLLPPTE